MKNERILIRKRHIKLLNKRTKRLNEKLLKKKKLQKQLDRIRPERNN